MKKITKLTLFTLSLSLITSPVFALSKEETVYSKLNTNGSLNYTIVTEHLKNDAKEDIITDVSNLTDIKNTNGDEKFDKVGNKIKWNSKGKDIYYEGRTDKGLPISVDISYELNNKKMKLKDIIGKSGNVKITINYKNKEKHNNLYTPFLVTTSTIIKNDNNSNINITNGKVIETGNNNVVVGLALPGMEDSLGVNTSIDLDKTVITYETKKFELNEIYMVATPKLVEKKDLDVLNNVDSLYGTLSKVSEATKKLEQGSKELKNGINTYTTKMNEYNRGMNKLSSGSATLVNGYKELQTGIATLDSKMPELQAATNEVVNNLNTIKTSVNTIYSGNNTLLGYLNQANSQINVSDITTSIQGLIVKKGEINTKIGTINTQINGLTSQKEASTNEEEKAALEIAINILTANKTELTSELDTIDTNISQLTGIATYVGTVKTITEGNEQQKGLNQVNEGLKLLNNNLNNEESNNKITLYKNSIDELANGISGLNNGSNKISNGLSTLNTSIKTLNGYSTELTNASKTINEGATKLNSGIEEFNNSINSVVNLVSNKAKNIENKAKELLKLSDEYQTFTMKENNIEGTTKFIMVVDTQK